LGMEEREGMQSRTWEGGVDSILQCVWVEGGEADRVRWGGKLSSNCAAITLLF